MKPAAMPRLTSQNLSADALASTNIAQSRFPFRSLLTRHLWLPASSESRVFARWKLASKDAVPSPCNCSGAGIRFFKTFKRKWRIPFQICIPAIRMFSFSAESVEISNSWKNKIKRKSTTLLHERKKDVGSKYLKSNILVWNNDTALIIIILTISTGRGR